MSEHSNKPSLREKLKNTKINRASIITATLLIAALAVIISVTVASNRSKKNQTNDTPDTKPVTDTQTPDTEPPANPSTPSDTEEPILNKPSNSGASQVEDKIPSFILPVSGVLSKKHDPSLQVYSTTLNDYRVHIGLDIVTAENAPVYAAADGTISKIWKDPMMGYCIAIKHGGDCVTVYKNLAEALPQGIAEGTSVRSGQLIAAVGDSSMVEVAEEPHLHFEMSVDDLAVDPLKYFDEKALESLSIDASHGE
ncbi:MAG: peptidoglycan DD-metalloendopeptidase family protein [Clostridia bacterium]|nr:peptidoglycan DD-metalloendopeptidase family protein [Clostridia bacterium]